MLTYIFYKRTNDTAPQTFRNVTQAVVFARRNPKYRLDVYDERMVKVDGGDASDFFDKKEDKK